MVVPLLAERVQRSSQHLTVSSCYAISGEASAAGARRAVDSRAGVVTRRVMTQGLNDHQACLQIGVNPTTGMRWQRPHHGGSHRSTPILFADPRRTSRDLAAVFVEDERVLIGDLLAAGHSLRSVAAELRRSPSTISQEIRRNISSAGNYRPLRGAPQSTRPPTEATKCRPEPYGVERTPPKAPVPPVAGSPKEATLLPAPPPFFTHESPDRMEPHRARCCPAPATEVDVWERLELMRFPPGERSGMPPVSRGADGVRELRPPGMTSL